MYVYGQPEPPLEARRRIAEQFADVLELDNRYWELGDEWQHTANGLHVDIMYRDPAWIEEQMDRILVRQEPWVGYSTCFWYNVLTSQVLFDRDGWFAALQARADQPYPEPLRAAIVVKNYPILQDTLSSYTYQLRSAVQRGDRVSVNHRVAAVLASYFDILFALNRLPHPGEKRLLTFARRHCALLPAQFEAEVNALLTAAGGAGEDVLPALAALVAGLEAPLRAGALWDAARGSLIG